MFFVYTFKKNTRPFSNRGLCPNFLDIKNPGI